MAHRPQVGEPAPDFEAPDQEGRLHRLADARGRFLALYFYPKDRTLGCTREACGFRDLEEDTRNAGLLVWGVSRDSTESHREFAARHALRFPLLSDRSGRIARAYGVLGLLGVAKRITFLIDPEGRIAHVYRFVNPSSHARTVLEDIPRPPEGESVREVPSRTGGVLAPRNR